MNLEDLQKSIAASFDADSQTPVPGTDDWDIRTNLINRIQRDWAERYEWDALYKEVNTRTAQATGNASIALPIDFRKLAAPPRIVADGTETKEYAEVNPRTRSQFLATDEYCYVMGGSPTYVLVINPQSLVSGASVFYGYWSTPTDLSTTTDVSPIPDPNYLVQGALAELFLVDNDRRATIFERKAAETLRRMVTYNNTKGEANYDRIQTSEEKRYNFRWGRD